MEVGVKCPNHPKQSDLHISNAILLEVYEVRHKATFHLKIFYRLIYFWHS